MYNNRISMMKQNWNYARVSLILYLIVIDISLNVQRSI